MADTTNRLAGFAFLAVNGVNYRVAADVAYKVGTVERTTLTGQDRVHGYSEMPAAPFISATLRDAGDLTVADFNAMTNETVIIELANGKTIVGRNMWTVDSQEVKTEEATFEVKWETLGTVEEA